MKVHFIGRIIVIVLVCGIFSSGHLRANEGDKLKDSLYIVEHYVKKNVWIPMRDGIKLFTSIYQPRDSSRKYPIMLLRTPYSLNPYGENDYRIKLGPSELFAAERYIFVYQDVRGCFMSEGQFENMRPQIPVNKRDPSNTALIDESTDTYDSIDWLLKHLTYHNGKVGMWGISYPGFYTAAGAIDAHPALKAVSPQAPIADWFWDDFHHHGAFFLPHAFNFLAIFGQPRHGLTMEWGERFKYPTPDGYRFYLEEVGPLKSINKKFYGDTIDFWKDIIAHPNYDTFWQDRNILPHLVNMRPAVMTVGGWYDAEDLYGPLQIYRTIEKNNPQSQNILVMGPWRHGGWARDDGTRLGNVFFGDDPAPSVFYQEKIEIMFFDHHLKGAPDGNLPEAYMFETGHNIWRQFDQWPPSGMSERILYFAADGQLSKDLPAAEDAYDEFISDPDKPVPFTESIVNNMTREYMTDDQRFASRRADVLVYQTEPLTRDMTIAGPLLARLWVSTSGSAADWVVKIIDVYPDDHPEFDHNPKPIKMGGYQQMVRSEVIRGRFRDSYESPKPFTPGEMTAVSLPLQDILHTFKQGHRLMVQVQSTWFPLVDRNPQKYVPNIFEADADDFIKATHKVYRSETGASQISFSVLED